MINTKDNYSCKNIWNHLTVCKQISSDLFKNMIMYKLLTYKSYVIISNFMQTIGSSLFSNVI